MYVIATDPDTITMIQGFGFSSRKPGSLHRRPGTPTSVIDSDLGSGTDVRSMRTRDTSRVRHDSSSLERPRGSPVIQTFVGTTQWPMLMKTNYTEWSSIIEVKLQVPQMWAAVRYGDVDFHKDRRALEALLAVVLGEMAPILWGKRTAKDTWDAIAAARGGSDCARRSILQKL